MNLELGPELAKAIKHKIESGEYESEDAVVAEALELLDWRDAEIKRQVSIGLEQLENGQATQYDDDGLKDLMDGVKKRGRERLAAQRDQG